MIRVVGSARATTCWQVIICFAKQRMSFVTATVFVNKLFNLTFYFYLCNITYSYIIEATILMMERGQMR